MMRRTAALVAASLLATAAVAQELEPRSYSPAPVGTNFLLGIYSHLNGDVLTDPSSPVTDVNGRLDAYMLGYARTFGLAGRSASVAVLAPFIRGHWTGKVLDDPREVTRDGMGDLRMRLAVNLIGGPAVTPQEFAQRAPETTVGASLTVVAPTGKYNPALLINAGLNRWAIKPEVGVSVPLGNWFVEGAAGASTYTDNREFLGTGRRAVDPLYAVQFHAGYNFSPGLWLAADAGHYTGGQSSLNGVASDDRQNFSRLGATLSVPFVAGWQAKVAWSGRLGSGSGGDFNAMSVALQYRWFDR